MESRTRNACRLILAGVVALAQTAILPPASLGQEAVPSDPGARKDGEWTVDDVLTDESAGQYRISPDNRWIVWVRSHMDESAGERVSNLWLTDRKTGSSFALTRGDDRNYSPRWSDAGERIAFLSNRSPQDDRESSRGTQVWVIRLPGGEPWQATRGMRSIRDFAWSGGGGDSLLVAAREDSSHHERELTESGDDTRVVEDTLMNLPVRLWKVSAGPGGDGRRVTQNDDWIRSVTVGPDGRRAAVVAGNDLSYQYDHENKPHTYLVDLESGERTTLFTGEEVAPSEIRWTPKGDGLYVSYVYSSHPVYLTATVTRMGYYDLAEGSFSRIDLDWSRQLGNGFEPFPGGFVAMLADGVHYRPAVYRRDGDGWSRELLEGPHVPNVFAWDLSRDGEVLAYTHSVSDQPPQPYWAELGGGRIRIGAPLDTLNPEFRTKPKPRTEIAHWEGARGDTVEGIVRYPLDYDPDRRYPLVLRIHGGPASQDLDRWGQSWADPMVLHNQDQAFVLQVNYHGSGNYGLDWVESIGQGNYYDLEVPDLEAGVDHLIERGLVHPDSVAVGGWSNGGILTIALTVENPDRYRAALSGAGDVEWISDWGNIDFGASFDNYYMGGPPYEMPERYVEKSPFFEMERVETPTIIFFGTEDRAVPTGQGWSHFRALQQIGKAPVRFLLFPGEPHGPTEYSFQRRKVEEEQAWLEEYLWGRDRDRNLALEEGSPLASAVRASTAARSDGRLGVVRRGTLVPEMVSFPRGGAGMIGRFEVTRAQWSEFRPDYEYRPGTGDLPVTGVSYADARAYVEWLSDEVGGAYRLPTDSELGELARSAPEGNTLTYWAGYRPNPDDAARLRSQAERLEGTRSLLRPVDAEAPACTGGTCIFGLAGNAAEWTVPRGSDGQADQGCAWGDHALSVAGRGTACSAPGSYTGLRVVAEPQSDTGDGV